MLLTPQNIVGIFAFYDKPLTYTIRAKDEQLYLVHFADYEKLEQGGEKEVFLYLPISAERIDKLKKMNFLIKEAFSNPEQSYLFVETSIYGGESIWERKLVADIDKGLYS